MLWYFFVLLLWCSQLQDDHSIGFTSRGIGRKGNFKAKKNSGHYLLKIGKFGVLRPYRPKSLQNFTALHRICSKKGDTHPIKGEGVALLEKEALFEQKSFCDKKFRKNLFIPVFRQYCPKTFRKFTVWSRRCPNLQCSHVFHCKTSAIKINDKFDPTKITFWSERRQKMIFDWDFTSKIKFFFAFMTTCPMVSQSCIRQNTKARRLFQSSLAQLCFSSCFLYDLRVFLHQIKTCSWIEHGCMNGCIYSKNPIFESNFLWTWKFGKNVAPAF